MSRLSTFIATLALLFIITGCASDVVFEQLETVDVAGWEYKKPVEFTFDAPDTTGRYNLIFDIRITPDYGYQNLWLFIETINPDGFSHVDSINCPMSYPDGRWVGTGIGDLIDTPILVHQAFKFTELGEYTFKIKHGMRNDNLPYVQNLGVILKKIKS